MMGDLETEGLFGKSQAEGDIGSGAEDAEADDTEAEDTEDDDNEDVDTEADLPDAE